MKAKPRRTKRPQKPAYYEIQTERINGPKPEQVAELIPKMIKIDPGFNLKQGIGTVEEFLFKNGTLESGTRLSKNAMFSR